MISKTSEKSSFFPRQTVEPTVAKYVAKPEAGRGEGIEQVNRDGKGESHSKEIAELSATGAILPPGASRAIKSAEAPSRVLTVHDGGNVEPIELRKGQPLVLELKNNPTTGFKWVIDKNMSQPKVTLVSDKAHHNDELGMPIYGKREQINHFMWTAKQIAAAGAEFVITARLVRSLDSVRETHFKIKVISDPASSKKSKGCVIQ